MISESDLQHSAPEGSILQQRIVALPLSLHRTWSVNVLIAHGDRAANSTITPQPPGDMSLCHRNMSRRFGGMSPNL